MGGFEVSYLGALGAGLLSFLSPCVLPLVPPYLCFLGGVSIDQVTSDDAGDAAATKRVVAAAFAFVLGFSTVFIALGATASVLGKLVAEYMDVLAQVAGVIIIILGLHFLGVFRIAALYRDVRFQVQGKPAGLIGAYVVGLAFAFGWTPCVGPVLAAILFVAGSEDKVLYGASLLGTYAAGIGVPFLLAAFLMRPFMGFMKRIRRHMHAVEMTIGGLLVVTGVLFLTGSMVDVSQWLLDTFPTLGRIG